VNLDALPYTSFIVLLEFTVGCLLVCVLADWRGGVAASFVKFCAVMVVSGAGVLLLNATALTPDSVVGGYTLKDEVLPWVKAGTVAFLVSTVPYTWFVLKQEKRASMYTGVASIVVGTVLIGLTAYYVSLPAWGYAGILLSIAAGALAVGAVVLAMTLGHWYLVTPRLPRQPLEELTILLLAAIGLQVVMLLINVAFEPRQAPDADAFLGSSSLGANPAFWLRIAIGLLFPAMLAWMAHVSSKGYPANEMAMMSATGLLYIAVGAVVVGEVLARGLLFLTGVPV
jgi:hypothetical protein